MRITAKKMFIAFTTAYFCAFALPIDATAQTAPPSPARPFNFPAASQDFTKRLAVAESSCNDVKDMCLKEAKEKYDAAKAKMKDESILSPLKDFCLQCVRKDIGSKFRAEKEKCEEDYKACVIELLYPNGVPH